ncbi:hypothetical protein D3C84_689350 [compost metagenome]
MLGIDDFRCRRLRCAYFLVLFQIGGVNDELENGQEDELNVFQGAFVGEEVNGRSAAYSKKHREEGYFGSFEF